MITIELPWPQAGLSPNARKHYMQRARLAKISRIDCCLIARSVLNSSSHDRMVLQELIESGAMLAVWIDFYPPDLRHRDDDNLIGRFKNCRDGVAQALGIDDKKFRTIPFVHSEKHPRGKVIVRISKAPDMPGHGE